MTAAYPQVAARARKNESVILQRLAKAGQVGVAEKMGISESKVSRYKNGELTEMSLFLAALGLKVVPEEMRCYNSEKIDAIFTLAQDNLSRMGGAHELADEDPE